MRRRCLVFEMAGVRRKNMDDGSNCSSSMLSQSDGTFVPNDKQLVPLKPGNDSSRRILPGIGLHLNALATTSKDYNIVKHETLTSGRQLISVPSSSGSYLSTIEGQEPVNKSLALNSLDRETDPAENGFQALEDASQASAYAISEELNQSSPKKKRHVQFTHHSYRFSIFYISPLVMYSVFFYLSGVGWNMVEKLRAASAVTARNLNA